MLAIVKRPRTNKTLFEIKGNIPKKVVEYLHTEFGQNFELFEKDDHELLHVLDTNWFQKIITATSPGDVVRIYRENSGLSHKELGEKLGNVSEDNIAEIERDQRPLTHELAEQLAQVFGVPVERFVS